MSGNFISTGLITNNGKKELKEIERLMNLKINDLSIQVIPLSTSNIVNWTRVIGIGLNYFIHPAFTPHLSHIAIQLNMENGEDIIIMEYGQYYSVDSDEKKTQIFFRVVQTVIILQMNPEEILMKIYIGILIKMELE